MARTTRSKKTQAAPEINVGKEIFESLLQTLYHVINRNALDLFQFPKAGEDFFADIYLGCFGLLLGILSGCHFSVLLLKFHAKTHQGNFALFKRNGFLSGSDGEFAVFIAG